MEKAALKANCMEKKHRNSKKQISDFYICTERERERNYCCKFGEVILKKKQIYVYIINMLIRIL